MHPRHQSAHHVGTACHWVVCRAGFSSRFARVVIINIATMQEAVVPIFIALEGGGRTLGLLCVRFAETKPCWLLVAAAVSAAASAFTSSSAVVGHAPMLRGGVAAAWGVVDVARGLLANGHAKIAGCLPADPASWPSWRLGSSLILGWPHTWHQSLTLSRYTT